MRSAWANLRAYPARFVAVLLAIAIGVGFTVATLIFTASFQTDLTRSIGAAASKVDVIVLPYEDLQADDPRLHDLGVAAVEPIYSSGVQFSSDAARGWLGVETVPADESLRWFALSGGSWPSGLDQVAVDPGTAERNGLSLGSRLTLADVDGGTRTVQVTGLLDTQESSLAGASDSLFAAPELASVLADGRPNQFDLTAADGVDPVDLAARVATALGSAAEVRTGAEAAEQQVTLVLGASDLLGVVLLTFAAIAGLVASFVIANTFTILLAQRQRQLGLLRCVGATRQQVRRSVLAEALLVGTIGSTLGAVLGAGAAVAATAVADVALTSYTVPIGSVLIALLVGIAITVLAALAPASRAMRVTPLAALSPVPTVAETQRSGRVRLTAGGLLTVAGVAGLAGGVVLPSLPIAVAGGALSAAGLLLLLRSVLPGVLRGLGRLTRFGGVSARLAAANAQRNPGRAAATSTALVIAVGLIVTLQVAAASARSSLNASLAEHFPLDVSVLASPPLSAAGDGTGAALPPGLLDQLSGVAGLTVLALDGVSAELTLDGSDTPVTVLGAPANVGTVIRSEVLPRGTVALPDWMLRTYDVAVGDLVTITADGGSLTLSVADSQLADGDSMVAVLDDSELGYLAATPQPMAIWGQLADIDDANEVISQLKPLLAPYATVELSGAAADHAAVDQGLSNILLVVTALLAVAAVIAVVGIGNTLGLSVVERTRESALLRALGLRRGQLRLMLAVEAALLAAVGAVVGIILGAGYGWIGAAATFAEAGEPLALAFPGDQVLLVLGLALVAGVVASVLPGRRAALAAPTEALAEV